MYKKLINLCIVTAIWISDGYKLLERSYYNNDIDIHVGPCPIDIDCVTMIFDAADEFVLPGNYRQINWYFDGVQTQNYQNNGLNELFFKYMPDNKGHTEFKTLSGKILEFNMNINPYGLTRTTIYNVIVHEFSHVFLLGHGEYQDSITGFLLPVLPSGNIIQSTQKLKMTSDDCYGIYIKMIDDIILYNYKYANSLNTVMSKHCPTYPSNKLIPSSNLFVPMIFRENIDYSYSDNDNALNLFHNGENIPRLTNLLEGDLLIIDD